MDSAKLITNPSNIFYYTNFSCDPHERLMALIIKNEKMYMLVPQMEYDRAIDEIKKDIEIVGYLDTEDGYAKLHNLTGDIDTLLLEEEHLTVSRFNRIINTFNVKNTKRIDEQIINQRKIKSEYELDCLRKAAYYADKAIQIGANNLREGISEIELKSIIESEIKKLGIKQMSFDTIVLFGKNASNPHGESGDTRLEKDDFVLMDLGVMYKGYASDETRTIAFGNPSEEAQKIYDIVKLANMSAIKAVRPGVSFSYIDKIARDIIENAGYGKYFTHRLGHGLGIDVHEYPDVSSKTDDLLEENMVFTIEPGIYKYGVAGVRIEDDVVVTSDGCEILTKYEK